MDNNLQVIPQAEQDSTSIMRLVAHAMDKPDFDVAKLQALLDVKDRWEKLEAKKAFVEAMTAFKANPPAIYKDKENTQYSSWYTSIAGLVNPVNEALSRHGLSARWDINQAAGREITVTCILTHKLGHSEQCSMSGPPDVSGKKNPLQELKSTVTYLKVATFEAITGVASENGNLDDDGNAAGKKSITPSSGTWESLTVDQQTQVIDIVECVRREYEAKGPLAAVNLWRDEVADLSVEAKTAGWAKFDSKERSAMKNARHEEKRDTQINAIKQGAARA